MFCGGALLNGLAGCDHSLCMTVAAQAGTGQADLLGPAVSCRRLALLQVSAGKVTSSVSGWVLLGAIGGDVGTCRPAAGVMRARLGTLGASFKKMRCWGAPRNMRARLHYGFGLCSS